VNDLDNIYKELGKDICLMPFLAAFYQTHNVAQVQDGELPNSVRPCSLITKDTPRRWAITNQSVYEARNSPAWREIREQFVQGQFKSIDDCSICIHNELVNGTSPRKESNRALAHQLDINIVDTVKQIIADDYYAHNIYALDYYPSNYCNLECVMCGSGSSSRRQVFEVKFLNQPSRITFNEADPDFLDALHRVQVINFAGGETMMQPQFHKVLDYQIDNDLAHNVIVGFLTNATSNTSKVDSKFQHFRQVVCSVSIDGVGEVIEYQRRGCNWAEVSENALTLMHHTDVGAVVNYVLTNINVFSFMDFVDWCYTNDYGPKYKEEQRNFITITPVFRADHLSVTALPPELKHTALSRLHAGLVRYRAINTVMSRYYSRIILQAIDIVTAAKHDESHLMQFVQLIQKENLASARSLQQVVPEWAPYLQPNYKP
jgi:MoaA/NifB/PqqE/SkfB family radical SAM enzyme